VRSRENLDVIVGAVIGPASRPAAVGAGRYTDTGELVIVGRTTALDSAGQAAGHRPDPGRHR